jgi:predicted  nucleic acid-binding Zn-ribbon protein
MKEELNQDTENLRKRDQTEILEIKIPFNQMKNEMEGHSSRLQHVEDRISGLENKMDIKEKTELLVKHSRAVKGICKNSRTQSEDQT